MLRGFIFRREGGWRNQRGEQINQFRDAFRDQHPHPFLNHSPVFVNEHIALRYYFSPRHFLMRLFVCIRYLAGRFTDSAIPQTRFTPLKNASNVMRFPLRR
jgi:hypothetical protein